jgi:hypothetical protein
MNLGPTWKATLSFTLDLILSHLDHSFSLFVSCVLLLAAAILLSLLFIFSIGFSVASSLLCVIGLMVTEAWVWRCCFAFSSATVHSSPLQLHPWPGWVLAFYDLLCLEARAQLYCFPRADAFVWLSCKLWVGVDFFIPAFLRNATLFGGTVDFVPLYQMACDVTET